MQHEVTDSVSNIHSSNEANFQPTGVGGFVDDVREQMLLWHQQGLKTALLTLVNVEGSSPRTIGSQMLVNEAGQSVGMLSGGCVESALVETAVLAIQSGQWQLIRYGLDSDYFDIKLPCGSGIDVLISPVDDGAWLSELATLTENRQPFTLLLDIEHQSFEIDSNAEIKTVSIRSNQWSRQEVEQQLATFTKTYVPRQRLFAVGQGAIFDAFLNLSAALDMERRVFSSTLPNDFKSQDTEYIRLTSPGRFDAAGLDQYSAMVLLSHDHDWDIPILIETLKTQVTHIAVLGSRATHKQRLSLLEAEGVSKEDLARVKGPAGLDIGGNTPPEIALSILAEIVAQKNGKSSI